jgi:hypothetical protein
VSVLGLGLAGTSLVVVPFAVAWVAVALFLAQQHAHRARIAALQTEAAS